MSYRKILMLLASILVVASGSVRAHHGNAPYSDDTVTVEATVTEFRFVNPHVQLYFDFSNEAGEVEHWQGEMTAPNRLARAGWTKTTFVPGDRIQITGRTARNGGHSMAIQAIVKDGQSLPMRESLD